MSYERESDDSLFGVEQINSDNHGAIMQGYNILTSLAYVVKPKLYPFFVARWSH